MILRRRRWLVWPGLICALLIGAAVLLGLQLAWVEAGTNAWREQRHLQAQQHFNRAEAISPVNRWLVVFNRGVANYELQRWDAAADDFEEAATLAPVDAQCVVRLNWAHSLEAGADYYLSTEDMAAALVRYNQAQIVLALAQCPEDQVSPSGGSLADEWGQSRRRLEDKITDSSPTHQETETDQSDADARDELDERARQAQEQRQRAEDRVQESTVGDGERTW